MVLHEWVKHNDVSLIVIGVKEVRRGGFRFLKCESETDRGATIRSNDSEGG